MNQEEKTNPDQGQGVTPPVDSSKETASPGLVSASNLSLPTYEALGPFVAGIDERCLWMDPLAEDPRVKSGAVLLSDVISDYVSSHNILFDNKIGYDAGKLKGGSYTMTPDENQAWTFASNTAGQVEKKPLDKGRDVSGEYYIVPPNSLVYIRLKQRLRLPFYIIGRHNLKIRYVYKGLLLGTGPQVDPGFEGNLFIPLHNFTTSNAHVYITGKESSFVSIDFVRTTSFLDKIKIPATLRTVEELRKHLETINLNVLIEKKKVERFTLEDYLEGDQPRSQLAQFQLNNERFEKKLLARIKKLKMWARIERIAIFLTVGAILVATMGVLVATLNYYRGFVADVKSETKDVKALAAALDTTDIKRRISTLESNSVFAGNIARSQTQMPSSQSSEIEANIGEIEKRMKKLELRIIELQAVSTNIDASSVTNMRSR